MLIIAGTIRIEKPATEEVLEACRNMMEATHEEESYEFVIPESLVKEELELVKEILEKFTTWRQYMPVSEIEIGCQTLREKLTKTKLINLIPLLEKLEESAENFNINTENMLLLRLLILFLQSHQL